MTTDDNGIRKRNESKTPHSCRSIQAISASFGTARRGETNRNDNDLQSTMMTIAKRSTAMSRTLWEARRGGRTATETTATTAAATTTIRKRSLATTAMAAAAACVLPRFPFSLAGVAAANEHSSFGNGRSSGGRFGIQTARQVHPSAVRHWSSSSDRDAGADVGAGNATDSSPTVSEVLRTLARRWDEPVPLRAAASSATNESPAEDRRRTAELADELVRRYSSLPPLSLVVQPTTNETEAEAEAETPSCERRAVVSILASECRPDNAAVEAAVDDWVRHATKTGEGNPHGDNSSNSSSSSKHPRLREATTPTYEAILDLVMKQNALDGMAFLIALREDLRTIRRHEAGDEASSASLRDLDGHLRSVLSRWFAPGLLVHERITYERSPAAVVEAVATTEAVHPVRSLRDLKDRLSEANPKRVFGLFHPLLPRRPLVVVHAALLGSVPACMNDVLEAGGSAERASVAAFYSISNGVKGLAGVGLGEFLLKETIRALADELPSLRTFVTLSPIPGFRNWIRVQFLLQQQQADDRNNLISLGDRAALRECGLVSGIEPFPWEEFLETLDGIDFAELRAAEDAASGTTTTTTTTTTTAREDNDSSSRSNPQQHAVIRTVLLKLVSRYLALEKHRGKPLDKVCGFHVGNGAEIHEVRFAADVSRGGLSKSYGLMVNYLYDTDKVPVRQRNFESSLRTVPVGPAVRKWLE